MKVGDVLYRAEAGRDSVWYWEGTVFRLTPKGFWVRSSCDVDRWFTSRTRQWSETREEALVHLAYRKARAVWYRRKALDKAEGKLALVLPLLDEGEKRMVERYAGRRM